MSRFFEQIMTDPPLFLFFSRDSTSDFATNFSTLTSSAITNSQNLVISKVRLRLRSMVNKAPGFIRILGSDGASRIGLSQPGIGERTGGYVNYEFYNPVITSSNFFIQWVYNGGDIQWYGVNTGLGQYSFYVYAIKQSV